IILILTLLFTAIILSTQFSFGRFFATLSQMATERWAALRTARAQRKEEQARDKQRQDVIKKHLARETPVPVTANSRESKDSKPAKEPMLVSKKSRVGEDDPAPAAPVPAASPMRSKTAA